MTIQNMREALLGYFLNKNRVKNMSDSQVFAVYTKLHLAGKV